MTSIILPGPNGPLSVILTTTDFPFLVFVTFTIVPNGFHYRVQPGGQGLGRAVVDQDDLGAAVSRALVKDAVDRLRQILLRVVHGDDDVLICINDIFLNMFCSVQQHTNKNHLLPFEL